MTATVTCPKCSVDYSRTVANFSPNKLCGDGLTRECRACMNTRKRKWKHDNASKVSARRRVAYAADPARYHAAELARAERAPEAYTAERLIAGARDRCRERELPCDRDTVLNRAFVVAWLTRQPMCECCGAEFSHRVPVRDAIGGPRQTSPSFDQFEPSAGYTLANTRLICWRCNNIKRNYSADDLKRVAAWMEATHP